MAGQFAQPLHITGAETADVVITVSLSTNNSFEWVEHGGNDHVVVKRLRDTAPLSAEHLAAMKVEGEKEMGRPYDIWFNMDEERIYCSELVWKIYERGAGLRVGLMERFADISGWWRF